MKGKSRRTTRLFFEASLEPSPLMAIFLKVVFLCRLVLYARGSSALRMPCLFLTYPCFSLAAFLLRSARMATDIFCEACPNKIKKHSVLSGFEGVLRANCVTADINIYIIKDLGGEVCRSKFAFLRIVLSQREITGRNWQLFVKVEVVIWRNLWRKT